MAELTLQAISPSGIDISASLAAADVAGDKVRKSDGAIVAVANGGGSAVTVTVASPVAEAVANGYGKQAVADIDVSVPAGETRQFTVPSGYTVDGFIEWTYSGVASVTVGVFSAGPNA